LYWKDGSVRYDFEGDSPMIMPDDQGRPLPRGKGIYSVIRTNEMIAAIEDTPLWGTVVDIKPPPTPREVWEEYPSYMTHLDPWVHYASSLRPGRSQLAEMFKAGKVIESEEDGGRVLLRLIRHNGSWVEITCDPASDDLPIHTRAGDVQGGKSMTYVGTDDVWKNTSGVWYPTRHIELGFLSDGRSFKTYDLTVRNLQVNDSAKIPDAAFTVGDMPLPDGSGGLDYRKTPPTALIKVNGIVRTRRPTERPIRRSNQPAPAPRASATPGGRAKEEYLALVTEYETARQAAEKAAMADRNGEDLRARLQPIARVEADYAGRFLEFAARQPKEAAALDALAGVLVNRFTPRESELASEILIRDHIRSAALVPVFRQLGEPPLALSSGALKLLRAARDRVPTREARGRACFYLALLLKHRAQAVRELQGPEPDPLLQFTAEASGLNPRSMSASGNPDELEREAAQLFDQVVEKFAEIPAERGPLGQTAATELFRLRELGIGKVAPEVEGPDVEGRALRLSDYRGKVVVLIFSGNWCGPCRAMYPHERELIKQMKDRPFALLSVNTDPSRDTLRDSIRSGEITWRCWWEGGDNRPNCTRYRVEAFPTIYVLDPAGVIRAKDVRGKALEVAVERLLKEADEAKTSKSP
jgi:thiol-disulfide isomerase/thioredoxin